MASGAPAVSDFPDRNRMRTRVHAAEWTVAPVAHRVKDHKDVVDRALATSPFLPAPSPKPIAAPWRRLNFPR
jgi:hypothetical protein